MGATVKLKLLGVAFLCLLLAGVWLTYGVFTQKFTHFDEVTLDASTIGLQMPERADVKVRGVIVGEVLGFQVTDQGARVQLGIDPSQIDSIPANVTGAIVPKTLFGEKYVSLVVPPDPSSQPLQAGDTVRPTAIPTEVEKVLADLYPLLRTVQPADLNTTLNAISTALEGRGDELGQDLVTVDHYLARINPQIPAVVHDLRLTTRVSNTYADVTPALAQILRNTIKTTGTLQDRHQQLKTLFTDVTSFSDTAHDFLRDNGDNIIRLGQVSAPTAQLLARYSPEYPCLLKGLVTSGRREAQAFRGFTLHIVLETLPNQPRGYTAADRPVYGDHSGPSCLRLANPPWSQSRPVRHQPNFKDGVDTPTGKGTDRVAPSLRRVGRLRVRRQRRRSPPSSRGCSVRRSVSPQPTSPTSGCCWSGRWPAARRCRCDEPPRCQDPLCPGQAGDLHGGHRAGHRGARDRDRQPHLRAHDSYAAEFSDATGLVKGDDVRIAGVKVGSVENVSIVDRTRALVRFKLDSNTTLTRATHADIRYRNLVGQRYVALTDEIGSTDVLKPGDTIPLAQTSPALDLTVLFNGFKPLFQALSPAEVNQLSYEIIQVFQGQGGTLDGMLAHTASITQTLADRDQVIGQLISNLNSVLDHVGKRNHQLNGLITTFRQFVGGLKRDRGAILGSLDQISHLSTQTADLVSGIRAPFVSDIHHLRGFAANLDQGKAEIDRALQVLPIKLTKIGRTAIYGSWFNFYLCNFTGQVRIGSTALPISYDTGSDRCHLK